MNTTYKPLTIYREGGIRELLYIALPLIMVTFSTQFMLFCDRIILARYSTLAMSAACSAGTVFSVFQLSIISIAAISEVFVGQYNGAQQYHKIATAVWQMIWFSLASIIIYLPFGLYGAFTFVPPELLHEGAPYYRILMYCCPLYGIIAALSAFYVGRGKVRLVTLITITGDLLNILLDFLLIFGYKDLISSLGTAGSAIATNISQGVITVSLFLCFLHKKNRQKYHTHHPRFNWAVLKKSFIVGFPNALGHMIEISAWAFLFHVVSWESTAQVIVLSIGQNIFLLFQFMSEGLTKAITTITANFIGAQKWHYIKKGFKSALIVHIGILCVIGIPTFLFPECLAKLFLHNVTQEDYHAYRAVIQENMAWMWIYLLFDGFVWVIVGILTAGGDTKFIMMITSTTVWITVIIPIYLITRYYDPPLSLCWQVTAAYGFINFIIFFGRYASKRWIKLRLSGDKRARRHLKD